MTELRGQNKITFESSETTRFLRNLSAVPNSLGIHGLMAILNAKHKDYSERDESLKKGRKARQPKHWQKRPETFEYDKFKEPRGVDTDDDLSDDYEDERFEPKQRIYRDWRGKNPHKNAKEFKGSDDHLDACAIQDVYNDASKLSSPIVLGAYDAYKSTTKSPTFHKFMQTKKYTEASAKADEAQRAFIHAQLHEGNPRMIQACHYMTRPAFT
jgi:hypothetical protein